MHLVWFGHVSKVVLDFRDLEGEDPWYHGVEQRCLGWRRMVW